MENKEELKPTKVRCLRCAYEWVTMSQMDMVTCPSCIRKTIRVPMEDSE